MDIANKYDFSIDITKALAFSNQGTLKHSSTDYPHYHDYHQLLFINEGISLFEGETTLIPQYSSMAAFIPQGYAHRTKVLGGPVKYKTLYMHSEYCKNITDHIKIFKLSDLSKSLLDRLCTIVLTPVIDGVQKQCFDLLVSLLHEEIHHSCHHISLPCSHDQDINIIISYIQKNYSSPLTLSQICSNLPYTVRHISRLFKNKMGITIMVYLRLYRILQASIDIQCTQKKIIAIAFDCGYDSISSFYKDFAHFFSVKPNDLRNS